MASAPPETGQPFLEIRKLVLAYQGRTVLNAIDLTVGAGEFLAVLALGGAGKSVLFRAAIGLEQPTAGQVLWFGHEVSRLSERQKHKLRRSIGAVHQEGALFADLTVEENIQLPLVELSDLDADHIENTVRFTLGVAGLLPYRQMRPAFLPTVVVRKAALARALALSPRLLICDDIFAGLDRQAQDQISHYLRALHLTRPVATLILTHNVAIAFQLASRIAILADGRIVASGPPEQIRADPAPEVRALLHDAERY